MRNTVIINGVSSATIGGLLIQELPPITKPPMRYEQIEIDGRSGDIITRLGYGAYDKTFRVGLHGNYDINEVIAFFAQKGTVTFSNEADKMYSFECLEQIDFERLVRFRTADVIFHVQPYKYPVRNTEPVITGTTSLSVNNIGNADAYPVIEVTGSGSVTISLNSQPILSLEMGDSATFVIDCEAMDATSGGELVNRQITGNYEYFFFPSGESTVTLSGSVTSTKITNYTRWL